MIAAMSVSATVIPAGMRLVAVLVIVMIAMHVGLEVQISRKERSDRLVRIAADAAVQLDSAVCKRHLRASADSAANQHIRLDCRQNPRKRTVSRSVRADNLRFDDFSVLDVVHLKLFGTSEVLKNFSVFVSYCNSHNRISFLQLILLLDLSPDTVLFITKLPASLAKIDSSALDFQSPSHHERFRDLLSCRLINLLSGRSAHAELYSAFFLTQSFPIDQSHRLKFVHRQNDAFAVRSSLRQKFRYLGKRAYLR